MPPATGAGRGGRLAEEAGIDSVDRDEFSGLRLKPKLSFCRYPWVRWPPFMEKGKAGSHDTSITCRGATTLGRQNGDAWHSASIGLGGVTC
jgi:hypothetical protein